MQRFALNTVAVFNLFSQREEFSDYEILGHRHLRPCRTTSLA